MELLKEGYDVTIVDNLYNASEKPSNVERITGKGDFLYGDISKPYSDGTDF